MSFRSLTAVPTSHFSNQRRAYFYTWYAFFRISILSPPPSLIIAEPSIAACLSLSLEKQLVICQIFGALRYLASQKGTIGRSPRRFVEGRSELVLADG